jgi:hypothetical protein
VTADVLLARVAAALAIKPGHGFERTDLQRFAEHIAGWGWSSASVATVVSEHDLGLPAAPLKVEIYNTEGQSESWQLSNPATSYRGPCLSYLVSLSAAG